MCGIIKLMWYDWSKLMESVTISACRNAFEVEANGSQFSPARCGQCCWNRFYHACSLVLPLGATPPRKEVSDSRIYRVSLIKPAVPLVHKVSALSLCVTFATKRHRLKPLNWMFPEVFWSNTKGCVATWSLPRPASTHHSMAFLLLSVIIIPT